MAAEPAVRMMDVTKRFGRVYAVQSLDLAVYPGEMVGLVGPDGAGKTTAARLAAGVLAPTSGRVAPEGRGRAGYLSGRFSLYPDLTVWENITFFARVYGMTRADAESESRRLLDWVGLLTFRDRLGGQLSGGMRQKLALACAVIHRPPILILDEPTTAVDPVARGEFWDLLRHQAGLGTAVLVTTPYMDEAEHCHRVGLLHLGRLLAVDTPAALRDRLPLRMMRLTGAGPDRLHRSQLKAAAAGLPGVRWLQPMGDGVRVALDPERADAAAAAVPAGLVLTPARPTLEDAFIWLSGGLEEVSA